MTFQVSPNRGPKSRETEIAPGSVGKTLSIRTDKKSVKTQSEPFDRGLNDIIKTIIRRIQIIYDTINPHLEYYKSKAVNCPACGDNTSTVFYEMMKVLNTATTNLNCWDCTIDHYGNYGLNLDIAPILHWFLSRDTELEEDKLDSRKFCIPNSENLASNQTIGQKIFMKIVTQTVHCVT